MLKTELRRFLIVGVTTVLIDFICYHLMLLLINSYAPAKAFGFIMGSIFAYFINKIWTFRHRNVANYSVSKFALLYMTTLMINVGLNGIFILMFGTAWLSVQLAFLIATGTSAVINFMGMKRFVFVRKV